jgi:hypothetical protein
MYCIWLYGGANRSTILARQELSDAKSTDFTLSLHLPLKKA